MQSLRHLDVQLQLQPVSLITELIKERTIQEALNITNRQVDEALGGLPQDKARYAVLAEKVLKAAIHNYNSHLGEKGESK